MKVVVDTNIIFSGILNPKSPIAQVLTEYSLSVEFYSCTFLLEEIEKHFSRLSKFSGLTEIEIKEVLGILSRQIHFIDDNLIRPDDRQKAILTLKDGDQNDTPFVALAFMLNSKLWTGDKKLINCLRKKRKDITISTPEIVNLLKNE